MVGVVRHSHTHSKSTHTQLVQGKEEESEWGVYVESITTAHTVAVLVSSKSSTGVVSLNEKARGLVVSRRKQQKGGPLTVSVWWRHHAVPNEEP